VKGRRMHRKEERYSLLSFLSSLFSLGHSPPRLLTFHFSFAPPPLPPPLRPSAPLLLCSSAPLSFLL